MDRCPSICLCFLGPDKEEDGSGPHLVCGSCCADVWASRASVTKPNMRSLAWKLGRREQMWTVRHDVAD